MKQRRQWTTIAVSLGMLMLILDGKTALAGGQAGVSMCIQTVIPSLFPFFILSVLLTGALNGTSLPLPASVRRILGIPEGGECILICGFLGGYPVGAQCISSLVRQGGLSQEEGERMLCFCSNAGPAFLFGMAASLFPNLHYAWLLWGIHIFSALLVRLFFPGREITPIASSVAAEASITTALGKSLSILSSVCGWIILFRVAIAFLNRWILWAAPLSVRVWIIGMLELANGCCALSGIPEIGLRFILCAGMLSFGGICVAMQTASITDGLSLRFYYIGKVLQTVFSLVLAWSFTAGCSGAAIAGFGLLAVILLKKTSRISVESSV